MTNWGAEMGPPHGLQRSGWRRETLKIGESVSVDGFLARNGENRMNARTVTLTVDGRPARARRSTPIRAAARVTSRPEAGELAAGEAHEADGARVRPGVGRARRRGPRRGAAPRAQSRTCRRPGPAPRDADGRAILWGATPDEKGVWTPMFGITDPINPVDQTPFQPWAKALYDARQIHELEPHTRCKASGTRAAVSDAVRRRVRRDAGAQAPLHLRYRRPAHVSHGLHGRPLASEGPRAELLRPLDRLVGRRHARRSTARASTRASGSTAAACRTRAAAHGRALHAQGLRDDRVRDHGPRSRRLHGRLDRRVRLAVRARRRAVRVLVPAGELRRRAHGRRRALEHRSQRARSFRKLLTPAAAFAACGGADPSEVVMLVAGLSRADRRRLRLALAMPTRLRDRELPDLAVRQAEPADSARRARSPSFVGDVRSAGGSALATGSLVILFGLVPTARYSSSRWRRDSRFRALIADVDRRHRAGGSGAREAEPAAFGAAGRCAGRSSDDVSDAGRALSRKPASSTADAAESQIARSLILGTGVAPDRVRFDDQSLNTCDSARATRALVEPKPASAGCS